jgi:membrane-bound lytic murein transglycosylase F
MRAKPTKRRVITAFNAWLLLPLGSSADDELAGIQTRGELRILVWQCPDAPLPRIGSIADSHRHAAAELARDLGVKPRFINACDYSTLFDKLIAGEGDLIADHLTITPTRSATVQFSNPLGMETQRLVTRTDEAGSITNILDLKGRSIAVPRGTALAQSVRELQKLEPSIDLFELPSDLSTDVILDMLTSRLIDLTMADGHIVREIEAYRDDVHGSMIVRQKAPVAWAFRKESRALAAAANRLITNRHMIADHIGLDTGDLAAIRARGTLRVLTRNSASCYFLWRGQLMGYEYEMARHFAEQLGLYLDVIVPHTQEELIPMLKLGRGDLIAGFLTDTPGRRAKGVTFSRPYHAADELIIARKTDAPTTRAELAGRTIVIREASSYWETAAELRATGLDIIIKTAPPSMETEEIIRQVAANAVQTFPHLDPRHVHVHGPVETQPDPATVAATTRPHGFQAAHRTQRIFDRADDHTLDLLGRSILIGQIHKKFRLDKIRHEGQRQPRQGHQTEHDDAHQHHQDRDRTFDGKFGQGHAGSSVAGSAATGSTSA